MTRRIQIKTVVYCFLAVIVCSCHYNGQPHLERETGSVMLRRNIGDTSGEEGGIYGVCRSFGGIFNARPDLRKDDQLNSLLYEYWLARGAHHTYEFLFRGPLSPQYRGPIPGTATCYGRVEHTQTGDCPHVSGVVLHGFRLRVRRNMVNFKKWVIPRIIGRVDGKT